MASSPIIHTKSQFRIENYAGTTQWSSTQCYISYSSWSGTYSCSGAACRYSNSNDCSISTKWMTSTPQRLCLKFDCENTLYSCDVRGFTFTYSNSQLSQSSSSPPPSPPPPSPPPTQTTTQGSDDTASSTPSGAGFDLTKNCKCSCCKGNGCVPSLVASYGAFHRLRCNDEGCASQFSSVCPDLGFLSTETGSVSATFDSSAPIPSLFASPPPPDLNQLRSQIQSRTPPYQKSPPIPPVTTQRSSASTLPKAMVALVGIFFAAFATF